MSVAFVSTGGTIAMAGRHPYDWYDYAEGGVMRDSDALLGELGPLLPPVTLESVPFRTLPSTGVTTEDWLALAALVRSLVARADIDGVVVTHGTATLEETAWFLALTVPSEKPVVLTGAQRPPNTTGSDAAANVRAALIAAAAPALRGCGVVVAFANRLYGARRVTKLSNHDLDAFADPESGAFGRVMTDGGIVLHARPLPPPAALPWHELAATALPRVEITYSHAGNDGTAVRAFVAAGAEGIVCAALPPGRPANAEREALKSAVAAGITVVLASRALRSAVEPAADARRDNFLFGSDLGPAKTRILVMLALAAGRRGSALQSLLDAL